jgi:hypothetical protein
MSIRCKIKNPIVEKVRVQYKKFFGFKPVGQTIEVMTARMEKESKRRFGVKKEQKEPRVSSPSMKAALVAAGVVSQ